MTDKQIIIDGTQCRYASFDGGNTQRLLCAIDDCFCDCYRENDCYYKQLKAKEQECEELRQFLSKEPLAIQALQKSYESYQKSTKVFSDWVKDYKQLITEIKEIAEKCCIMQAILDCENYDDCTQCGRISDGEGIQQILQKISECEGNDEIHSK